MYELRDAEGKFVARSRGRAAAHRASRSTKRLGASVNRAGSTLRYELRGYAKNSRGRWTFVRTSRERSDHAHTMAMELWRLNRENPGVARGQWRYEVRDLGAGRGKLAPVVSYEELVRRAGSVLPGESYNRANGGSDLRAGDPVEVREVWASLGGSREPLRSWFAGYEFVRHEGPRGPAFMDAPGGQAIVRSTSGTYEGVESRWPAEDVRPAREKSANRANGDYVQPYQVILQQLGGAGRLRAMIGANLSHAEGGNRLDIQFPNKMRSKPNFVQIWYEPGPDAYAVIFWRVDRSGNRKLREVDGIYADSLVELFERETGLYIRL